MSSQYERPLTGDDRLIWGVLDSAPDGIFVVDDQGLIVLVNRQAEELFGYRRDQLVGERVETLVPEGLAERHRTHRSRYLAEPRTRAMGAGLTLKARRADGREFPAEISLSSLRTGGKLQVVASVRDVTERVAAEARMRQVLYVLDHIQDAVFFIDRVTGRFTRVNQGATDQVGYSAEELTEMGLVDLMPELTEAELGRLLAPVESGEVASRTLTTTFRHQSGFDVPVELVLQAPASLPEDEHPPVVAIARDVRERLSIEAQRRRQAEEAAVVEDRDRVARDLHDTVIQRIFAAGLDLHATMELTHQQPAVTERLQAVVDELDAAIRELRGAVLALRLGQMPGRGLRNEVGELVAEAERALGFPPQLTISGPIDDLEPEVSADVLAALREMLSNVVRHARARAVQVEVGSGEELVIRVTDDGIGLVEPISGGRGLYNLQERAAVRGGSFSISLGEPSGTVAEWRAPLPRR